MIRKLHRKKVSKISDFEHEEDGVRGLNYNKKSIFHIKSNLNEENKHDKFGELISHLEQ